MSASDTIVHYLTELGEDGLTELLELRPDLSAGAPPGDLRELAQRLQHPQALISALHEVPRPYLQLCEAMRALGDGCRGDALAEFVEDAGPAHRPEVDRVVDALSARAVIRIDADGAIRLPEVFNDIFSAPLGFGDPLEMLLRECPVDAMRRIGTALGLPKQKNRAGTLAALLAHLRDGDTVRAIVAAAPSAVAEDLTRLAEGRVSGADADDPRTYRQWQATIDWGSKRGLLFGNQYGFDWQMPAEIGLSLSGPGFRAPFNPFSPEPTISSVDVERVEADSAAAATEFAGHVLAVLDQVSREPVAEVKSGGIGVRTLTKLAKSTAAGENEVRMVLELAASAGLVGYGDGHVAVSEEFRAWRELDPGERLAVLLSTWWSLNATPTEAHDEEGKALRVLATPDYCMGCHVARVVLLDTLADLDGGTDRASAAAVVHWRRPLIHLLAQDEDRPLETVWREAEMLGVVAQGTLSELGKLVRADDIEQLGKHAGTVLPRSADKATFCADLTVFVAGEPSAAVSRLLDSAADREGRGGAVVWRFSPASVRRAMDEGIGADELRAQLSAMATGELPQPLRYLIDDVARRHGQLRLTSTGTCVHSEDSALLAEVAADRKLAKVGLRLLAPTVAVSNATVPALLEALRAAGHAPVADDGLGRAVALGEDSGRTGEDAPVRRRGYNRAQIRAMYPEPERFNAREVAAALIRRGAGSSRSEDDLSLTLSEQNVASFAKSLSEAEIRQLAYAIDTGSRVCIDYQSSSGARTRRVIDSPELSGGMVFAWCEPRNDDRVFTVSRIRSVIPV